MRTTIKIWAAICILFAFLACEEESADPSNDVKIPEEFTIVDLLGDKDGFGMGLEDGEIWKPEQPGLPIVFQDNDPDFTDIYPAHDFVTKSLEYTHRFDPINGEITSAHLTLFTLGIQDGDDQVYQSDVEIKIYLDTYEIKGALDEVDQFDFVGGWYSFAGYVKIQVPEELFEEIKDGEVHLRWMIYQLDPNSQSTDAFAIDYSELTIEGIQ